MELGKLNIPKIKIEPFAFIHDFQTRLYLLYADFIQKTEIGRSVVDMLSEDPRVSALKGKMISRGDIAHSFEIENLAMWFCWYENEHGPGSAKEYLESFLDSEEISVISKRQLISTFQ